VSNTSAHGWTRSYNAGTPRHAHVRKLRKRKSSSAFRQN
jgi:hypothetical protein